MSKPKFDPNKPFEAADKPKFDPNKPFEAPGGEEQGLEENSTSLLGAAGKGLLGVAGAVGSFVDRFTGAPTRAGIGAIQDGKGIMGAIPAATEQFGADPELAPTGKQIAQKAGVPDTALSEKMPYMYSEDGHGLTMKKGGMLDPTASGAAGLVVDVAADPTNIIPGRAIVGAGGKGLLKGAKLAEEIPVIGKAVSKAKNAAKEMSVAKVASTLTGVPEKEIATYLKEHKEVEKLISEYGSDMSGAVDKTKETINNAVKAKRIELSGKIEKGLAEKGSVVVDANPVIKRLEEAKSKLNKTYKGDDIAVIDAEINRLRSVADESGNVLLADLYAAQKNFQEMGKGAYLKQGQMISAGDAAQKAMVGAGAEARKIVNAAAPEIAEANNSFSAMHRIEKSMNRNLIKEGGSDAALLAAGAGPNRQSRTLGLLGKAVDKDLVSEAEKLASAKRFANPEILPVDPTGKSLTRMAVGSGLGLLAGGVPGVPAGLVLTSPAALKVAIKGSKALEETVRKVLKLAPGAKITEKDVEQFSKVMQSVAPSQYATMPAAAEDDPQGLGAR